MTDIALYQTNDGGDILLRGSDMVTTSTVDNMIFMALFGGNDFWGNTMIDEGNGVTFNSLTEKTLNEVTLNSSGRIKIQEAVIKDLAFLKQEYPTTTISVSVSIENANRVGININFDGEDFYYQWQPNDN